MRATPIPARFLVTVGLLLATVGGVLATVEVAVRSRADLVARAEEIAATTPVHDALAERLANTLAPPNPDPPDDEIGQPNPALPVARRAVTEPAFTRAFARTLGLVHDHVVEGSNAPLALDPDLVGRAVAQASGGGSAVPVPMDLDADLFPDAHRSIALVELASRLLLLLGVAAVAGGVCASHRRARTTMRLGRWAVVVGVVGVLVYWALPDLVLVPLGGWAAVGGLVIESGGWLALPSLGLVLVGALLVAGGHLWETRVRRRTLAVVPRRQGRETWAGPV
jgi:hypothetical protein